jgi:hypothetical protein
MLDNSSGSIWLLYYPTYTDYSPPVADVKRNQLSYKLDLMTFEKQHIICPTADIQSFTQTGADYVNINSSEFMETDRIQYLKGQLAIASDNSNTNANTTNLFSITVRYSVDFYFRR